MDDEDALICCLSDFHSGGTTALFPNETLHFDKGRNHSPNEKQLAMYIAFVEYANRVRKARQGKRLIIVHNGDAIEGIHHGSTEYVIPENRNQRMIHVHLMKEFMDIVKYGSNKNDKLFYVKGTEIHTADEETVIGKKLGAEQAPDGLYAFDFLNLEVNNTNSWFVHHGPNPGKGANIHNSHVNWLKNQYFDCIREEQYPPNMIVTSHFHQPLCSATVQEYKGDWFMLHGIITPSWQQKTRYGNRVAPTQRNKVGLAYYTVTKGGDIRGWATPYMMDDDDTPVKA